MTYWVPGTFRVDAHTNARRRRRRRKVNVGRAFVRRRLSACSESPRALTPLEVSAAAAVWNQGLTLVHISAQRKHFLWDRGCIRDCSGGV